MFKLNGKKRCVCVKKMKKWTYFNNTVAQNDNLQYRVEYDYIYIKIVCMH